VEAKADLNVRDSAQQTPIYRAARLDNVDVVRYLVKQGADEGVLPILQAEVGAMFAHAIGQCASKEFREEICDIVLSKTVQVLLLVDLPKVLSELICSYIIGDSSRFRRRHEAK